MLEHTKKPPTKTPEVHLIVDGEIYTATAPGLTGDIAPHVLRMVVAVARTRAEINDLSEYRATHGPGGIAAADVMGPLLAAHGGRAAVAIKAYREENNLTQAAFAKLVNMPQSNISQIEKGTRKVGRKTAHRLADVLDMSPSVLIQAKRS